MNVRLLSLLMILFAVLISCKEENNMEWEVENGEINILYQGQKRLIGGSVNINMTRYLGVKMIDFEIVDNVLFLSVNPDSTLELEKEASAGIIFSEKKNCINELVFWRYRPWNSWTIPIRLDANNKFPDWDVQFHYWRHSDGTYGAMLPISSNGYRTTLGRSNDRWGSKAVKHIDHKLTDEIPCMSIAFGKDPYELFERIYRVSMEYMGKANNLQKKKDLPEPFKYLGWCSWNSSSNGKNLNEKLLIDAAESFQKANLPLGWLLIDDGWLQNNELRLTALEPDPLKFPIGLKPVIDELKLNYGIKYVGIWHTMNAYWNGIDPESNLGKDYKDELFSWTQKEWAGIEDSPLKECYFFKPDSDSLLAFYDRWYHYFRSQGIDFVKVDNQVVTERMAVGNYPIFYLSEKIHQALNLAVSENFNNAIINCMDMTAEAYLNFGETAVGRTGEDYVPYKPEETYFIEKGNAAAHIVQTAYNSIYFSQMVFPDFDMFQSHNPNAEFHAIFRAINNGPVYITDDIGKQDFDVLRPLIYSDGKIIRSQTSLLPTEDCLFQVQDSGLFKAFSKVSNKGLMAVWNAADIDQVNGYIRAGDINGIAGKHFLLYEYFSGYGKLIDVDTEISLSLPRMGYKLFYIIPIDRGSAVIGLSDKYNAPATILTEERGKDYLKIILYEGGLLKIYTLENPDEVWLNGKPAKDYTITNNMLCLEIDNNEPGVHPEVMLYWK